MKTYDLAIIGAGPAGVSAAKVAVDNGLSVVIFERGRDLLKRKDLISGWFGKGIFDTDQLNCKDNLIEQEHIDKIHEFIGNFNSDKTKIGKLLASFFIDYLQKKSKIYFNSEVLNIEKNNDHFVIRTIKSEYKTKFCIISTGKYSQEWLKILCKNLGINILNNEVKVGVRVEIPTFKMKENEYFHDVRYNSFVGEWEESNVLSAFGYSKPDKKTCKTNFMVVSEVKTDIEEVLREIKIINILHNNKIKCERVYDYMLGKSSLKYLSNFNNLKSVFEKIETLFPSFISCAIMYVPEIRLTGILPVDENMKTSIEDLYGAGECTSRINNLIGALASGLIASNSILKE